MNLNQPKSLKRQSRPAPTDVRGELSTEQRAAISFIGALRRAGLDWSQPGVEDSLQVPTLTAAGLIGVKQQTLALWRCERMNALPHVQIGRRIFYRLGDLRRFVTSRTQQPRQAC